MIASRILWLLVGLFLPAAMELNPERVFAEDESVIVFTPAQKEHFRKKVQPIFGRHCILCHGSASPQNGLRLDNSTAARKGGDTGRPIVGGTLETNEVYRRVSSTDAAYRMPKRGPALTPAEVDAVRKWVQMGCPWPDDEPAAPVAANTTTAVRKDLISRLFDFAEELESWLKYNPYFHEFCWFALACLLLTLSIEQLRRQVQIGQVESWFARTLVRVGSGQILCFWGIVIGVFLVLQARGHRDQALKEVARLQRQVAPSGNAAASPDSLRPGSIIRLTHPNALQRTYYRGNCERNVQLFNGGNYCTATMRVSLQTSTGVPLEYDQNLPEGDLVVRFELVRAPGATPLLYTEDLMQAVSLVQQLDDGKPLVADAPHYSLETVSPGDRWACEIAIERPSSDDVLTRRLYVVKGRSEKEVHYGIEYTLHLKGGLVQKESDIWMGCTLLTPVVQRQPPVGMIPFCEWFDWRPLPEITGPNAMDPKLLGVPEHRPGPETSAPQPESTPASEK